MIYTIIIADEKGIAFKGKTAALPLAENLIIKKSVEWLNDPEPCIIHKTYVIKKILSEIDDYISGKISEGSLDIPWECVPPQLKDALDIRGAVEYLQIIIERIK